MFRHAIQHAWRVSIYCKLVIIYFKQVTDLSNYYNIIYVLQCTLVTRFDEI